MTGAGPFWNSVLETLQKIKPSVRWTSGLLRWLCVDAVRCTDPGSTLTCSFYLCKGAICIPDKPLHAAPDKQALLKQGHWEEWILIGALSEVRGCHLVGYTICRGSDEGEKAYKRDRGYWWCQWRYGANNKIHFALVVSKQTQDIQGLNEDPIASSSKRSSWQTQGIYTRYISAVFSCVFILAEDILDEVSGLTVNSPDETLEEGPQLLLQSPGGHQEDQLSTGTRQKVGCRVHIRRYDSFVRACGAEPAFQRLHHRPGDKLYTVQSPPVTHPEECFQQVLC